MHSKQAVDVDLYTNDAIIPEKNLLYFRPKMALRRRVRY